MAIVKLAPPAALTAVRSGATQITVSWQPSPYAGRYVVERRSGGAWSEIQTITNGATSFVDINRAPNTTYAYRVFATDTGLDDVSRSLPSRVDVATTMAFTPVTVSMPVLSAHYQELLAALNAMRAAAGWANVSWSQILPPGVADPSANSGIRAVHLTSMRREMNNALQALGAFVAPYLDSDPYLQIIRAEHVTQLQLRAQ
jgi:hypothetical protein